MCGRFAVNRTLVERWVSTNLVKDFHCIENQDLCPSQTVNSIIHANNSMSQLDLLWGIKPSWSKKLLINAQVETVAEKPTFKQAFNSKRCVIPFSSWYEWQTCKGKKSKYQFSANATDLHEPLFMAGIYYQAKVANQFPLLVTLTTMPTVQCAKYHSRMPLLLSKDKLEQYLRAPIEILPSINTNIEQKYLISKV